MLDGSSPRARLGLALLTLLTLGACGSSASEAFVRRVLPGEVLARRAVAYSGYRAGQSPDLQLYPSKAEIRDDLALLVRGGWGFIRLFDSGPHAERVLEVIAEEHLDLKVMLGVWIAGPPPGQDAANRAEIERAVALCRGHADVIVAVSVGNETLDDWSNVRVSPAQLAAYITAVRGRVIQPVTTDDSWLPFTLGSDGATSYADEVEVARAVDFLSLHVYAFADAYYGGWDWKQEAVPVAERAAKMMAAAAAYTRASVRAVRETMAAAGLDLPIVLGEVGWKSHTSATAASAPEQAIQRYLAHPVNQKLFLDELVAWVYGDGRDADSPAAAFTFEAFDEPWKDAWGDDGWGLFDVERRPRYVVRDLYPDLSPADAAAYGPADAVCYRP